MGVEQKGSNRQSSEQPGLTPELSLLSARGWTEKILRSPPALAVSFCNARGTSLHYFDQVDIFYLPLASAGSLSMIWCH